MMTLFIALVAVGLLAFGVLAYISRKSKEKNTLPPPIEIVGLDPDDPYNDPEVRSMLAEVIRTGRPMMMNLGEKPRFIDTDEEKK